MATARLSLLGFGLLLGVASIVGCSADDPTGGADQDITPEPKQTLFEQAQYCDALVRDKVGVREADLKSGVLRWKCGDVDGVTYDTRQGAGFGQEYCEYHAVVNGAIVDGQNPPNGQLSCVFSSVFTDNGLDRRKLDQAIQSTIGAQSLAYGVSTMQIGFNSRGAAVALISDCEDSGKYDSMVNSERQVACFKAWKAATPENKRKLRQACLESNLEDPTQWQAVLDLNLGVKDLDPGSAEYDIEKDVAACTHGLTLGSRIVSWRNSDPTICARAMRAANECGDSFNQLPGALEGFSMTSWVDDFDPATPPQAPSGCKYVEVDGKPFDKLLVCSPPPDKVAQAKLAHKPMQTMCKEEFGGQIAMAAPIGAVANIGPKRSPFCDQFHAGARALQGGQ